MLNFLLLWLFVSLSSDFSKEVDLTKPGSYKVILNTILPNTIDSRAKAAPVEVTVNVKILLPKQRM